MLGSLFDPSAYAGTTAFAALCVVTDNRRTFLGLLVSPDTPLPYLPRTPEARLQALRGYHYPLLAVIVPMSFLSSVALTPHFVNHAHTMS
jgi:hypothetical protein